MTRPDPPRPARVRSGREGLVMQLVVLVGLEGSGKTTIYRERFAATHAHVSKDNFRSNPRPARRQRHLIEEAGDGVPDSVGRATSTGHKFGEGLRG